MPTKRIETMPINHIESMPTKRIETMHRKCAETMPTSSGNKLYCLKTSFLKILEL